MTTAVEIIEMPQPLGIFAGELFSRGSEYLDSFEILAERDLLLMHAKYFMLSHAMELLLKSHLAARGVSKADLRSRKFGHNLDALLQKSVELNLPKVPHLEDFIRQINQMNSDFDFRYPTRYDLHVPTPKHCLEVMLPFRDALKPIIEFASIDANLQWASDTRHLKGKKIRWSD